jgi:aspartate kinase
MGNPGNGTADLEATHENLQMRMVPLLEQGQLPIITGYYGCDLNGRPLTFGRGGSDYSAAVVAHGLDANCCEIWTDVNGFMTADPRVVKEAATIHEMDYGEAAELAYFGAKVLHPRTIEPVRRKEICLMVKNTFDPDGKGTRIKKLKEQNGEVLRSVAMKGDLSIIKIYSSEIVYQPELVSRLLSAVTDGVNTYAVSTSLSTLSVVIPSPSVKGIQDRLAGFGTDQVEKIAVKDNVSLICTVGDNMINIPGVAARVFKAVEEVGANIELISEGASDVALNFVVPSNRAADVVRKIHSTFIGGSS